MTNDYKDNVQNPLDEHAYEKSSRKKKKIVP
jgi:hypothetical protein